MPPGAPSSFQPSPRTRLTCWDIPLSRFPHSITLNVFHFATGGFVNTKQNNLLLKFWVRVPGISLSEEVMKTSCLICFALLILLHVDLAENGSTAAPKTQRKKMRTKGKKNNSANRKSGRQPKGQLSPLPIVATHLPLIIADDTYVDIFDSLIGLGEQESSYNILPGKKGQCSYNGMVMFDKAVWSPKPCITCLCSNGKTVCDEITCPAPKCLKTVRRPGECCPVCKDIVMKNLAMDDSPDFSGDSPEPNDPSEAELMPSPRTPEEMEEQLRREEEERQEEEEAIRRKEEQEKKTKEKKREKEEKERKELEARRKEEEELERILEENTKKANEEEEQMLEEEERKKREEEERRKEDDKKKKEEEKRREKKKQQERERQEESEEDIEGEEPDEDDIDDLFRSPPIQGPDRTGEAPAGPPPLPHGCFVSYITVSCTYAKLRSIPAIADLDVKYLELLGNSITTIPTEGFNGMPNLERINLGKNNITSTNIGPEAFKLLKNLKRLYLDGNALVQIPSDLPPTLEELKLNDNNLQIIDEVIFQDLHNLVTLELEGNRLSEANVDPLAFQPLKHLSYLRLGRNKFRTIPQGLPPNIEELHLENNLIEEITETAFNHTRVLNSIVLRHNKLEESRIAPLAWIHQESLESIDLSYNKLVHVPSYLPKALLHLVLLGNQIERIPGYVFAHMDPGLEYLYLSYNKLPSDGIDLVSFHGAYHSLRELFLDHNELTTVPAGMEDMKALQILRLNDNKIRSVPPHSICSAAGDDDGDDDDGDEDDDEDSKLEHLYLQNNYIRTRDISPYAFMCVTSYSSIVLKPQYVK